MIPLYEFIAKGLADNEYGGLYNEEHGCACLRENLAPCGTLNCEKCKPGYLRFKVDPFEWWITPEKKKSSEYKQKPCWLCEKTEDE
jgi:hypothetical protein